VFAGVGKAPEATCGGITVNADGAVIVREGHGSGEGRGNSSGEVHDIALKAAETDATKRALATFGKPFGLALYRKEKTPLLQGSPALQPASPAIPTGARVGSHPDDTTPIPRPSHYYGRRHESSMTALLRRDRVQSKELPESAPPTADATGRVKMDKSELAIPEPKRLRDKAHLKFVASQPCLVCGRQPSDPHHLRFAQPRAIGLKVSDEFTVHCAAATIGSCIRLGMKRFGGKIDKSMCSRPRDVFGLKHIRIKDRLRLLMDID